MTSPAPVARTTAEALEPESRAVVPQAAGGGTGKWGDLGHKGQTPIARRVRSEGPMGTQHGDDCHPRRVTHVTCAESRSCVFSHPRPHRCPREVTGVQMSFTVAIASQRAGP